ncbi:uncharacterized protein FOMMEDRAFT_114459 [Fomitiporia mediterranea MF3/22]|uniref:uncharacterized protein n=1 Tax=Fomitiporia mediterranea (strain MF3/22) TaxID=694068 RepID=UPI00044079AF|nr:uncharacterized protein FOMMEDRAFT_114459 [Fomitiporia mediterranea MF3/22]EJC98258.1 hypothetical protein FOMMEDRAFT_114459 [Fomitiporia mediterranea MF3/22]
MSSAVLSANNDVDLRSLEDYSDVASWINDVLDEEGDDADSVRELSELERRVSQLSAVLEVACEDTSAQLEKTIDDVSRTVPRLTYDLQLMQESALSLQNALQAVERHSASFLNTSEIGPVLEQLHFLDTVKRNMDASLVVLREAEAWSSLESEVVTYLSEQAYSKAASRLSEASKSLSVFQNTPEYETRKTLMINLQNQLEAALSSALVAGINSNDVDACKRYFDIFCHIEREAEFRSYWNGSKRKGIVALWQETDLRDCDEASEKTEGKKLSAFLPEFYQEIISVLQVERLSAMLIFPDPQPSLSTFITSILSSLHPSTSQRLNALVNFHGDLVLPELMASFKATEEFAVSTDKIMEKVGYSSLSPAVVPASLDDRENVPSNPRTHTRRRSTRQSFSKRLNRSSISGPSTSHGIASGSASLDHTWEETLFEPFLDYQCDYAMLEKRLLRAQLKDLPAPTSAVSTGARLLRERAIDVLSFADEALARCMVFTHGYGVVGLIQALDDLFEAFLQSARRDILESGGTPSADPNTIDSGEEFAELDYSASDLAVFQLTLHLLEAARSVLERLTVFEAKLRANVQQTSNALRMGRNDPFGLYVSGTTRTALTLLQSSVLNSIELQNLLDAVDPEQPQQGPHGAFTPSSATFAAQKAQTSSSRATLLLGARKAVSEFAKACQMRLQETILTPLLKHLSTYASSAVWISADPKDRRAVGSGGAGGTGTGAISEVVIPTFSLSPTATIQRVAEGLLSLPRLFEVYADDDALAFSIETLPFVDSSSLRSMSSETATTSTQGQETDQPDSNTRPKPLPSHSQSPPTLLLTPEAVSSAWLSSLALSLLDHLTTKILPSISRLSTKGAAQLAEDLSYLGQICRAIGVEWPALEAWREAVGLDVEELRRRRSSGDEREKEKTEISEIFRTVTKLRSV